MKFAAEFAKGLGMDAYTTTLLISPYQNHEVIRELAGNIAKEEDLRFYYSDFREGFRASQQDAKEFDMYRQKYCGCVFSELERVKVK